MKKAILLSLSLLFLCSTFAQKDNAASTLLRTISTRYKKFKTIKADFTYTIENKAEKAVEKQRGFIYIKGNKFRLDIAGQLIICDNATIWTFTKEVNEVQINNYNPKAMAIRLEDILTMYDKGFLSKIVEEKKETGKEIVMIELTPKDKKKSFFKIKLTVDKTNQTILKSVIYEKSGVIHSYTITNQFPNIKVEDKFFTFDAKKYPGVEIVDLRN